MNILTRIKNYKKILLSQVYPTYTKFFLQLLMECLCTFIVHLVQKVPVLAFCTKVFTIELIFKQKITNINKQITNNQ